MALPSTNSNKQQISYDHGLSDTPLLGMTISEALWKTVQKYPDAEALVVPYQNYRLSYRELWDEATKVAKGIMAFGIKKGDRVGIWSPNRYEWVLVQFATAQTGAILVNINPAYKSAELEYALRQSEVRMLIMSRGFRKTNYVDILHEVRPSLIHLKHIVVMENDWQNLLDGGKKISDEQHAEAGHDMQFDEPINIQYTSGTTGFPKGATLSHHNILNNGFFIGERLNYTEKDRVCIPVPLYHCFGMVLANLACITHGSCMVFTGEAFEPASVMQTVQDEKCTSLYGVPLMFIAELSHPDFHKYDFSSLRTGIMAGASCPESTMRAVREKMNMTEVGICYGMTETSPVSTQTFIDDNEHRRCATVGKVHPHLEIKIIDPDTNKIVPRGQAGELCTRGYSVMLKYWNNPEATASVIDDSRWMHTGDLAEMDEDGYVKIVGRIKDLIIRGGENISPFEIEEFLHNHDDVNDIQVIGVPDDKYGEAVMAWVVLKDGATVSPAELEAYCRGQIATFKIPKYWKFVNEFPTTVTGKVRKVEMREISAKELNLHYRQ
ncbi:MAG: AMP-binding protein [Cyclobacteriaceae bacterium]|nr:AMP-binding protein [Cyclobacteriaceae bacterium]